MAYLQSLFGRTAGPASRNADQAPDGLGRLLRGEAPLSDDLEARLRARQVDAIHRLGVPLMAVNLVNAAALLLELDLAGQGSSLATGWSLAAMALAAVALSGAWRNRGRPAPDKASRRAIAKVVRSAALFGLLWTVPGLLIVPELSGMALAFGAALLTGMIAGGAIVLYPVPAAALAFLVPVSAGAVGGLALAHGWLALGPAILAVAFLAIFVGVIGRHSRLFTSEFVTRLDLEARNRLIEDLLEDARLEALGARRLSEARQAVSLKRQAVGVLAAGIAHSFNNLLSTIQGNAELAREGNADRALIDPILDSCDRGAAQVRQLLAIGQKQTLRPAPVDLESLLESFEAVLAAVLPGIRLRIQLEGGLSTPLADGAALESALASLVLNARDALPDGGNIVISARNAPRALAGGGDAVRITVSDDGIGMDAATRLRATDPFFTTKSFGAGSGLGLSAAAGFAEQSGGRIEIESTPGAGTRVSLLLPLLAPPARILGPVSVLVVDTDSDTRHQVVAVLSGLGCLAEATGSARAALAALAGPARFDMVLTDILLGDGASGIHLGREIGRRFPGMAVVFMSGVARTAANTNAVSVLPKPVTPNRLADCLRANLGDRFRGPAPQPSFPEASNATSPER